MAYTKTMRMEAFLGMYQEGDGVGVDPRYALEAVNVDTRGGVLQSAARGLHLRAGLERPIGTLMRLHRRWRAADARQDALVAASGGRLYWLDTEAADWREAAMPEGVEAYESDDWSWVTYEINPEGAQAPVDVLLISNARDGMYCVRGDDMSVSPVETPRKFGVIARYAERIWGGAILDDPDMLAYSAPFDPFDWRQNNDIPEDGAGDIRQPSWDGDSFTALTQFGAQLIAFKRNRVWRILGTDPGEYVFREQYGGGAAIAATVAVDNERILMLGPEGILRYDGLSVDRCGQPYARGVFERMCPEALSAACACMYRDRYYCALPLDGSAHNNAVLIFDTREQTWLLREGLTVRAFLPTDTGLYYTSATEPGQVWRWGEDAARTGALSPARWVGPWQDLGAKHVEKGWFRVYLSPEATAPAELLLTIRTERKARTKALRVRPGGRQRRLVYGGGGKRFRLELEARGMTPWRLPGGIQLDVELDAE